MGETVEGRTWRVVLSYDGTEFHGWQIQPDRKTVQGELRAAIERVTGESVLPQGSGRTDAGVHALGQVASFALFAPIPEANFVRALNRTLPASIRVLSAQRERNEFHARRHVKSKLYEYRIFRGPVCPPWLARYVYALDAPLDAEAMERAAQRVLGEHDFTSFASHDPDRKVSRTEDRKVSRIEDRDREDGEHGDNLWADNRRTIHESGWRIGGGALPCSAHPFSAALSTDPRSAVSWLVYRVRGSGFLHHMVRNLVGAFLEVGRGNLEEAAILRILSARARSAAPATAPARGLFLIEVEYSAPPQQTLPATQSTIPSPAQSTTLPTTLPTTDLPRTGSPRLAPQGLAPQVPSSFARVSQIASLPRVHAAFRWFHLQPQRIMDWQRDLVSIPAPPFGEAARAEWLAQRFRELKLEQVEIDAEGNVLGLLRSRAGASSSPSLLLPRGSVILLSAHLDTIFPKDVRIDPVLDGSRLSAPGACDNGAGIAGLLAVAAALANCGVECPVDLLFVGNVGEEGEGDLRGMRYLYGASPWREAIASHIVLDGAGSNVVVTQALGSRRYSVSISGPGGHSWSDAGTPNPIVVLSRAIAQLNEIALPDSPRTTLNIGTIEGGEAINSIPERAMARFDLRSLEPDELIRLEVALYRTVEDLVLAANQNLRSARLRGPLPKGLMRFAVQRIGDRPAGGIAEDAPLLSALRAVDRHLGIRTEERAASTDANIPLSMGIPAVSIGAGGEGGGVHTRGEWYDATGRELALKRILLLLLLAVS